MPANEKPKPGQKFPTPTPGFGDRVFYETLLRQRQNSVMAQEWCLAYGVLSHKKAEKLQEMVLERKKNVRLGGGASGATSPAPKKKKAKLVKEDAVDPDIQESGAERVGSAVL